MRKRKNEKAVYEVLEYDGDFYTVVQRTNECSADCAFYDICDDSLIKKTIGSCVASQRSDNNDIMVIINEKHNKEHR